CSDGAGACDRIIHAAARMAAKLPTSMAYAVASPSSSMMTPPTPGPTMRHVFHITWFRERATGSWRGSTRFGSIADRTDSAKPPNPPPNPAATYTSASGGWPISAATSSTLDVPDWGDL